ncbi:glycosyltransferase [Bacillus salipaludis]|uniref:glycosyltransferase family protein n=1 Tax=Bacillus salipaludis TaxID=2547811 RepID=UPI003D1AACEE
MNFIPDFILHYDIAWGNALSPNITGLDEINIPKGCIVIDIHFQPATRSKYFVKNKVDLIFSVTKSAFLKSYPEFIDKFRWWPFSVSPNICKDWGLEKDIDFLLNGQVFDRTGKTPNLTRTPRGRYPFREKVLAKMRGVEGFFFYPHPGHNAPNHAFVNENYAKALNRAKIFFTCGSVLKYPVLKFFEAPACRTLLLAEPVPDILELGFKDGINFVACDQVNFFEKAMYYIENQEERQRITDCGYQFIHTHHSNEERARQLVKDVQDFIQNKKMM